MVSLNIFYFILLLSLIYYCFEKIITINTRRIGHKSQKHWKFRQQNSERDQNLIEEKINRMQPKHCGRKLTTNNYIVGGMEANKNEFPFVVGLRNDYYGLTCMGTIISDRWILTAAHCMDASMHTHNQFGFIAGTHEYSVGEKYRIKKVINHNKFKIIKDESGVWAEFDIALVKTDRKIRFNSAVNAICLPTVQNYESFGLITTAGWGVFKMKNKVDEEGESSPVLRKVNLEIISDEECSKIYSNDDIPIIRSFLCAKHIRGSVCSGDSGGPAFKYVNGRAVIAGIVSWGNDDYCKPGEINVFTQVSNFLDWILLTIDS